MSSSTGLWHYVVSKVFTVVSEIPNIFRVISLIKMEEIHTPELNCVMIYKKDQISCFYLIPYILESNPHHFYTFRGLKIRCGLDSRSRAGFWKNDDRAGVRALRTIQLFIILFIISYNILKYL
jgi:hypothetical protein